MEDEAGGDAGFAAEAEARVGADIVELNEPHSHTLSHINVNAAAQSESEGGSGMRGEENGGCRVASGLMCGASENVNEGRNSPWKEDSGPEQIGVVVQAGSA